MKNDQNKLSYRFYPLKRLIPGCLMLMIWALGACSQPDRQEEETTIGQAQSEQLETVTVPIEGMTCNACVASVKRKFKSMEGLEKVEVSLVHRNATLTYDPDKITTRQIRNAIHEAGYKAGEPITETNR